MEFVSDVEKVGMDETECLGCELLSACSWVENELNPALSTLSLDVVLDRSTYLAFTKISTVDEFVQK
jgi:hypothetical protein